MKGRGRHTLLPFIGGIAALSVAAFLLIGLAGSVVALPGLGLRNWLVVLLQMNAGAGALPADPLRVFNPLDVVVLVLVAATFLGLSAALREASLLWLGIAVALPLAGIPLLLTTHLAGRSSVMGAGLIVSFLLLRHGPSRRLAYLGLVANGLLLAGDFTTTGSPLPVVAGLFAAGYVLLLVWFVLIGRRLLAVSRSAIA